MLTSFSLAYESYIFWIQLLDVRNTVTWGSECGQLYRGKLDNVCERWIDVDMRGWVEE